jgi:hypothetical protein
VGTLAPQDRCQAVLSGNRALVHAVDGSLRSRRAEELRSHPVGLAASAPSGSRSWLAWDEDKQRRLLRLTAGRDVA